MIKIAPCACGKPGILCRARLTSYCRCPDSCCWHGPDCETEEGAIAAWNSVMSAQTALETKPDQTPNGPTLRVRGVVWLDIEGGWQLAGGHHWTEVDWREKANDKRWPPIAYITADVPIPQPVEIAAKVEDV